MARRRAPGTIQPLTRSRRGPYESARLAVRLPLGRTLQTGPGNFDPSRTWVPAGRRAPGSLLALAAIAAIALWPAAIAEAAPQDTDRKAEQKQSKTAETPQPPPEPSKLAGPKAPAPAQSPASTEPPPAAPSPAGPPSAAAPPEPPAVPESAFEGLEEKGPSEYHAKSFDIPSGQTVHGDRYFFGGGCEIDGTLDGDFFAFSGGTNGIQGVVTGDINLFGSNLNLSGEARDDVRALAGDINVSGPVFGDLMLLAGQIRIQKGAKVAGQTSAAGGTVLLAGEFAQRVSAAGGVVTFSGIAHGDVRIEADVLKIEPGARIKGNLKYEAREENPLLSDPASAKSVVDGTVTYVSKSPEEHGPHGKSAFGWLFFFWTFLGGLLLGFLVIAIARRPVEAVLRAAREDALRSLGFGVLGHVFAPFAGLILIVLCLTFPAGLLVLALWAVLFYLAKLVVSAALADAILRRLGRPVSPYLALFLGMIPVWILFEVPVLGALLYWFLVPIFGIGATLIGLRSFGRPDRGIAAPLTAPPPSPTV